MKTVALGQEPQKSSTHSRLTLRVTTQVVPQSMAPGEVTVPAVLVTVSLRVAVSVRSTGSQISYCGSQVGGIAAAGPAVTASTATTAQSAASAVRTRVMGMAVSGSCGCEGRFHPASGNEIRSDGPGPWGQPASGVRVLRTRVGWRPPR